MDTKLQSFCEQIKVDFHDFNLLKEALTHRSHVNENGKHSINHNERLEFLGDAVLELVVTEYLFAQYPDKPEGDLTSFRAALVRTESLAEAGEELNFGEYIYMSKGEERTGGRERKAILANTFEAVMGAMYLDQGIEICRKFVSKTLLPKLDKIVQKRLDIDAKSKLQELAQEIVRVTPIYQLKAEQGPDHDKEFTMEVLLGDQVMAEGTGNSKQAAEQQAANIALENWNELYEKYFASGKISSK